MLIFLDIVSKRSFPSQICSNSNEVPIGTTLSTPLLLIVSINLLTTPAIEIKNLSLSIPIYHSESRSITKKFANKVINITGGALDQSKNGTNIIALNNINLTIMKGERVGLIGHNGSGKSSFLRLISGIYLPTTGNIKNAVEVYPMLQKTFLTSSELSGIDACKAHYLLNNHSLKGFEPFLNEIIEFSGKNSEMIHETLISSRVTLLTLPSLQILTLV
mgnify:CR=1 FL=1